MSEKSTNDISFPHQAMAGALTMAFRENRVRELGLLCHQKERRTYTVQAVMTDNDLPMNCSLEEVLTYKPRTQVILEQGNFTAFKYYPDRKAVLFDLVCGPDKTLTHIKTYVSARLPELALGYARAAINQFIDTFALYARHPLSIQRMELMSHLDGEVLAFQITVPGSTQTKLETFHSYRAGGPFLNTEAIYREAIANPSPYYRLLLAFRGFEGVQQMRKMIRKLVVDLKVTESMPGPIRLDKLMLARLQFPQEVQALKHTGMLIEYYHELRDGVAHFLLDQNKTATGSLQFSSTRVYNYAAVSSLLLEYLRGEIVQLRDFYERHLSVGIHGSPLLWNSNDRGKHHLVVCPDDEATAPDDHFN